MHLIKKYVILFSINKLRHNTRAKAIFQHFFLGMVDLAAYALYWIINWRINWRIKMKEKIPVCASDVTHKELVEEVRKVMPNDEEFYDLADLYKMFADSTRVRILWALSHSELCVCDIALLLNMTKSAISHQLRALRLANLVKYVKRGKEVYYSLADSHVKDIFEKGFEHIHE